MFKSFRKHILFAALIATVSSLGALEVDENELKSAGTPDVIVFQNYTGPHSKIDSLESIKKLGTDLGTVIAKDRTASATAGDSSRYSVIHAVDASQKEKLDADIILIGGNATVDHIKNLRRIIASYLTAAYGYSDKDAETIATFVTVYNAVYRGNLGNYQNKYKDAVTKNLTAEKCGLSTNWKEWAGKSQIVIPLFDIKDGGISTVDTSVISDKEVVKRMQDDDDKNVDSRKDMVDLKEREAETAQEKASDSQKKAVEEKKKATEEKAKTETAKKEAETAKKEASDAKKKAEENPTAQNKKEAEKKQQVAEEKQKEAEKQEIVQKAQEEKAEEAAEEAKEQQEIADKKTAEAQAERKEIAKDQQEVIDKEIQDALANAVYGMELTDEKDLLSGMIKINSSTGEVMKSSPVTYIRNRTMFQAGENYIAVCGENRNNGTVKLVTLSPITMEIEAESNETVHENSVLIQDGKDFYCVIQDGKNWVLAKYDAELNLKLKSPVAINASTPVTVTDSMVIVTGANGAVKLLDKATLKESTETPSKSSGSDTGSAK